MKHVLLFLPLCLFCSSLTVAQGDSTASAPKIAEVMLMTGVSIPYLPVDFRNHSMKGSYVGGGYSLTFEPGSIGYSTVSATADYSLFRFDGTGFINALDSVHQSIPGLTVTQRPVKAFTLMLNYRGTFTSFSSSVSPYFLIGVGYMFLSVPTTEAAPDTLLNVDGFNKSAVAWSFGIGFDVPINETAGVFVQGKSTLGVMDRTRQYFPVVIGVRYRL